jgi:hypothetical protein
VCDGCVAGEVWQPGLIEALREERPDVFDPDFAAAVVSVVAEHVGERIVNPEDLCGCPAGHAARAPRGG